jgi:hypothetical protein
MNLRDELKQLKTDARSLRKFGLVVGGVFAALGLWFWLRHKPAFPYFLAPGALLIAAGALMPRGLKRVYLAWMALAVLLGFIVSNVLLTLFFFLVITPVGLLARLCGKDFLALKRDPQSATYWIRREPATRSKADHERQF